MTTITQDPLLQPGELHSVRKMFDAVSAAAKPTGRLPTDAAETLLREMRVPQVLKDALARIPEASYSDLLDAVQTGCRNYEAQHGRAPDPVLTTTALHRFVADTYPKGELVGGRAKGAALDSASNLHHDQTSIQPAAAILSVLQMYAEAHPLAAYLPTSVQSNEARLAVGHHFAQSDFGDYSAGDVLNGTSSGGNYFEGERSIDLGVGGFGSFNVTVTARNNMAQGAANPAVKLLRGRTMIKVNGIIVASEARTPSGSGPQTLAGQVTLGGVNHQIAGSSNSDTGDITGTFTPALPAGPRVEVVAYVDYERQPDLAPKVGVEVNVYQLFAHASRGLTSITIDASTQFSQEAGLDGRGQLQMALRQQFAAERFYQAHRKCMSIAEAYRGVWDYDYAAQIAQKDYAQLWLNLAPVLYGMSQDMAERTQDHGIDTLFVTGYLAARMKGLPSSIWQPSGITSRPGVYRMGRLFGEYDVYYIPSSRAGFVNTPTTAQILCMGRGSTVVRNPLVYGDAVPPVLMPLATNGDMGQNDGFYTRSFTEVNPHAMSAVGCAVIDVINMG